jgi:hypothetical protein
MAAKGYRFAIEWIALNDESGATWALERDDVASMLTVALLADLWGKSTKDVARDVILYRLKHVKVPNYRYRTK